jgi:DNA polymerase III sliding clamp (beta) subunit (PCNA family)
MSVDNIDTGLRLGIAGRSFEIARGDPQRPEGWSGVDWGSASVQSHGTAEFKAALDYCAPAISNDPTRFHLGGIYMGDDHMVATDGHRLHIARNIASFPGGAVILPSDAIAGLRAAIKQADAPWLMARHKKDGTELVQFHVEGVLLDVLITSRCIEGQFPPWDAVCPTHENGFAVDGEKWRESMQTATKLAGMESVWIAAHKECRVSIEDLFSEVMPLERRPPESVEMKFSPRYLLEAAAGADLVRVEYSGDLDAIVLRATDDHYAAVMPMR